MRRIHRRIDGRRKYHGRGSNRQQVLSSISQVHQSERKCYQTSVKSPILARINFQYGWLASKPEFKLEKFGQLVMKYPNPMANVVTPKGDMPSLSPGRPYYM